MLSVCCSQTDSFKVRRRLTDQRNPVVASLRQYIEDEGQQHLDDYRQQRPGVIDGDAADARRLSRPSSRHGHKKIHRHVDERRRYDVDDVGSQYNVLDQIGSNIIRRK